MKTVRIAATINQIIIFILCGKPISLQLGANISREGFSIIPPTLFFLSYKIQFFPHLSSLLDFFPSGRMVGKTKVALRFFSLFQPLHTNKQNFQIPFRKKKVQM